MQNQKDIERINHFVYQVLPIVADVIKTFLQLSGYEVQQEGHGLELAFSIKKGKKEAKMYLQNLLLEIATVDRDEEPMRFDENLRDFDFFLTKIVNLTQSKLKILLHLFAEEDIDAAIENITLDAKQYERIRIWQFDQKKPTRKHQH